MLFSKHLKPLRLPLLPDLPQPLIIQILHKFLPLPDPQLQHDHTQTPDIMFQAQPRILTNPSPQLHLLTFLITPIAVIPNPPILAHFPTSRPPTPLPSPLVPLRPT